MWKQLFEPHFLPIWLLMLIIGAAWLLRITTTAEALPLLSTLALSGTALAVGSNNLSAYQRGIAAGLPLTAPPAATPAPTAEAPAQGVTG